MPNAKINYKEYCLNGWAIFTAVSTAENNSPVKRFTFKISRAVQGLAKYNVFVKIGRKYIYIGPIHKRNLSYWPNYSYANSSRVAAGQAVRVFKFLWVCLCHGNLPEQVKIYRSTNCRYCNRTLTDPESIVRGVGSECLAKENGA